MHVNTGVIHMACTLQGECPMIPIAFKGTSIAAGKCVRCQHNSATKKASAKGGRGGGRR